MPDLLAVVTHQSETGLPKDSVSNTFAVNGGPPVGDLVSLGLVADAFIALYNAQPGGLTRTGQNSFESIARRLSSVLDTGALRSSVKLYDALAGLGPGNMGAPLFVKPFTLAGTDNTKSAFPSEVAVVVTLEAVGRAGAAVELPGGQRPKSRRTGRFFIGPVNSGTATSDNGVIRPDPDFQDLCINAVLKLDADLGAILPAMDLGVFSRVDGVVRPVEFVSVDNAFDTQRRRGEAATTRRRVPMAEA